MSEAAIRPEEHPSDSALLYNLRAVPALLRAGFASVLAYRIEIVIWMFTTNMPLIMLALWAAVARSGPVAGYTQADFTAYYLATQLVRLLTGCWVVYELTMEIRQGTLAMRLLRPVHPLLAHACENAAAMPVRIAFCTPLFVIFLALCHGSITRDPVLLVLAPITIVGAWMITFGIMAIIGTFALWVDSAIGLFQLWLGISGVLSGYLVPLDLFPPRIRAIAQVLPFRFTLSFPVELVLGRLDRPHALQLLAAQWGYVAFFAAGTLVLWRKGMKRFGAYGG